MTDPLVTEVVDSDGRHHFAATASKFVSDGLEDGSLTLAEDVKAQSSETGDGDPKPLEEVPDAAETPADSGDHNTTGSDGGPSDRARDDATAKRGNRAGKA